MQNKTTPKIFELSNPPKKHVGDPNGPTKRLQPARRARYSQAWCLDVESANRCRMIYFSIFFPVGTLKRTVKCRVMMQKAQQILKDGEKNSLQNKTAPQKNKHQKKTLLSWPSGIELDDIECLKATGFFNTSISVAECLLCPRFTKFHKYHPTATKAKQHKQVRANTSGWSMWKDLNFSTTLPFFRKIPQFWSSHTSILWNIICHVENIETFLFWGHLPNKASKLIQPSIHHLSYLSMVWKPQKYTPPKLPRKPRNKKTIGKKNRLSWSRFVLQGTFPSLPSPHLGT